MTLFKWLENRVVRNLESRGKLHDLAWRAHLDANTDFYGHQILRDTILTIPAVFRAVDFLAGTLARLPLLIQDEETKKILIDDPASIILNRRPARGLTSFDWRYAMWRKVFTDHGRAITFIERRNGRIRRLHWDINPEHVKTVVRDDGDWEYHYQPPTKQRLVWQPENVIDIAWMRDEDGITCMSPVNQFIETMTQAFEYRRFRTKLAKTGGYMPFGAKSRWGQKSAAQTTADTLATNLRNAIDSGHLFVPLPKETEIVQLGMTPRDTQMMESQQHIVRDVARIWGVPPIYLYDMDRVTYNNSEHQAIILANYVISRWYEQFQQQLSLKVAGSGRIVRHDLAGLLRGDYATRVTGHSTAIMSGQITPNEARAAEDRPPLEDGDTLFIQSGTVPIDMLREQMENQNNPPPQGNSNED